jgi:hypothetical protein
MMKLLLSLVHNLSPSNVQNIPIVMRMDLPDVLQQETGM